MVANTTNNPATGWRSVITVWGWPFIADPVAPGIERSGGEEVDSPLVVVSNSRWEVERWRRALEGSGVGLLVIDGGGWENGLAQFSASDVTRAIEGTAAAGQKIYLPWTLWKPFRAALPPSESGAGNASPQRLANGAWVQPAPANPDSWWRFLQRRALLKDMREARLTTAESARFHGSFGAIFLLISLVGLPFLGAALWLAFAAVTLAATGSAMAVERGRDTARQASSRWRYVLYALPVALAVGLAQGFGASPPLYATWGVAATLVTGWLGWLTRQRLHRITMVGEEQWT